MGGRIYHQQPSAIARKLDFEQSGGVDNHTQLMSGSKRNLYLAMTKILAESSVILLR